MPQYFMVMISGGVLILLGVGAYFWGRTEEGRHYRLISSHMDVKEFVTRRPLPPQPRSLEIGGWIAITVGLVLIIMGLVFWRWGLTFPITF